MIRLRSIFIIMLILFTTTACSSQANKVDKSEPIPVKKPDIQVFAITPFSKDIVKGQSWQIKSVAYDETGAKLQKVDITYKVNNPDIISVDSNGKIQALSEGKTDITITCGKLSLTSNITVYSTKDDLIEANMIEGDIPVQVATNGVYQIMSYPIGGNEEDFDPTKPLIIGIYIRNISQKPLIIDPSSVSIVDEMDMTLVPENNILVEVDRSSSLFKKVTLLPNKEGGGELGFHLKTGEGRLIKAKEIIYNDGTNPIIKLDTSDWVY